MGKKTWIRLKMCLLVNTCPIDILLFSNIYRTFKEELAQGGAPPLTEVVEETPLPFNPS